MLSDSGLGMTEMNQQILALRTTQSSKRDWKTNTYEKGWDHPALYSNNVHGSQLYVFHSLEDCFWAKNARD